MTLKVSILKTSYNKIPGYLGLQGCDSAATQLLQFLIVLVLNLFPLHAHALCQQRNG